MVVGKSLQKSAPTEDNTDFSHLLKMIQAKNYRQNAIMFSLW